MFLKIKDVTKESLFSSKIKYILLTHFQYEHYFGIQPFHVDLKQATMYVVQLNPDEDKYYLLTPYPTLMSSLNKFSSENIRTFARNPKTDLRSLGIYSRSDIQHHIHTQQFQELLTKMDTIRRQSIVQNLRKHAKTAGFSEIYTQYYSGYFKDLKDYVYLNGKKCRPQDIPPINIFSFLNVNNELLDFLGWPYYILERLTILYAMFNFLDFSFHYQK